VAVVWSYGKLALIDIDKWLGDGPEDEGAEPSGHIIKCLPRQSRWTVGNASPESSPQSM
jgi:hypothetical protein